MPFLKSSNFGEVFVDHSASPGIPKEQAERMGLDPTLYGEGKTATIPTLGCVHCGSHVIMNPLRTRERGLCLKCNAYICDPCTAAMHSPDYVHRTSKEIAEMVNSGKWSLSGTMSFPILTKIGGSNG